MIKEVYFVHAVYTEGPLYESLDATFERLNTNLGIQLQPSRETLAKIQQGELKLEGKEDVARIMVSPEMLDYNDHWGKIDSMLDEILSPEYRNRNADPMGKAGFSTGLLWIMLTTT